jgi:lysophospholipase L1-like esterase
MRALPRTAAPLVAPLAAAVLTLALAGCAQDTPGEADPGTATTTSSAPEPGSPSAEGPQGAGEYPRYVAIGDSYTAAPFVPETDPEDGCLRSTGNYPSLVAEALGGTELIDVSCTGADTTSLIGVQQTFDDVNRPPQLEALTPDTSLVTVSIGANDFGLFSTFVGGCAQVASTDPTGSPCTDVASDDGPEVLATIEERTAAVVQGIRGRAPEARILVVGYPQIVSQGDRSCPALRIAPKDLPFARTMNRGLSKALQEGARRSDAEYVDVYALTAGHDVCADDPWIAGKETVEGQALAFHPFAAEQQAVAEEILRILKD